MKTLAVIPARGGSKRIPKKNIKPFLGKPIIAYSIEAAIKSGVFDKIIVSTDSREIAEIAAGLGAETPFVRPAELADDFTGTNAVVKHAIQWFSSKGEKVEYVCCIYATAPFVNACHLTQAYETLARTGSAFVFAVTSFGFPIQRALKLNGNGNVEPINPEHIHTRSQDLEKTYHDAGQFYWGRASSYLDQIEPYKSESTPVVLPRYLVQDIDTKEDWRRAEIMYRVLQELGEMPAKGNK